MFRSMMLIAGLLVWIVFPTQAAEPYALRDFQLGMSLQAFRALPFPDRHTKAHNVCSNDFTNDSRNPLAYQDTIRVAKGVARLGLVRCAYFATTGSGNTYPASLTVAGVRMQFVSFYFIPDEDGTPSLGLIQITAGDPPYDKIKAALIAKFGPPTETKTGVAQNGFGATFEREQLLWMNPSSMITITKHQDRIDDMLLTYVHLELMDRFSAIIAAEDARKATGTL